MKITFSNYEIGYSQAVDDFLKLHGFVISDKEPDLTINVSITARKNISVVRRNASVSIDIEKPWQLFRALVILKEKSEEAEFNYYEPVMFETCGVMIDGSQASSLMNLKSCRRMIVYLASMGYNMMMLYCEDCYEIEGEPYFGNMRPRYTKEDFRLIDDYANALGIELVPCIQTLGHLTEAIKRPPYAEISDCEDILMVGDERTYTFIDKMVSTVSQCFRSRRIHIGMDEAWSLGLGKYLKINGYHPQAEIMTAHLARVNDIVKKHKMKPMMWADMFFRGKSKNNDYFDDEIRFTEADRALVPEGMGIVYWDYYHFEKEFYRKNLQGCGIISDNVIFAACARNVRTFAAHLKKTLETTNPAFEACRAEGIREVITTIWGDDHRESTPFATLAGLMHFAENMYSEIPPDEAKCKKRLWACVGADWEVFADISALDTVEGYNDKETNNLAVSRVCIWQDIMLGLCDANMRDTDMSEYYAALSTKLSEHAEKYPDFKLMLEFYSQTARVISLKQYLGISLVRMYKSGDREGLLNAVKNTLPTLMTEMKKLRRLHRTHFFDEFKPIGWEILDIRYGGSIMRIDTAIERITDYLEGRIEKIEELEEKRLSFTGIENDLIPDVQTYQMLCSASRI